VTDTDTQTDRQTQGYSIYCTKQISHIKNKNVFIEVSLHLILTFEVFLSTGDKLLRMARAV